MVYEVKLHNPTLSTFEVSVVQRAIKLIMEKNWALSVDQCGLQPLQFLVHFIDLLSILVRCNGFAGIQKAVVDQTSSRPPNSDHDLFRCKFGFGKCLEASSGPITEPSLLVVI